MTERDTRQRQRQFAVRRFLLIWIALTLIFGGIVWAFYLDRARNTHTLIRASERQEVEIARQAIGAELSNIRSDLLYLARQSTLQNFLATGAPVWRQRLASDFLVFAEQKRLYDQVRFVDAAGREVVRVNWNGGRPAVVPPPELQDKSGRYYVRQTLALADGSVYMSPFDLNIEHGTIEQPPKPTIRFGTPVFDRQGRKRGMVLLNYLGQRLIDRLRMEASHGAGAVWLLNGDGYWLVGPRPQEEWGFMHPGGNRGRFDKRHPRAWALIEQGPQEAQFVTGSGLYTYRKVSPSASVHWIVVSRVPAAILAAQTAGLSRSLGIVFALLTLLLAATAWAIAFYSTQRRLAVDEVRASEIRFRGLLESAPEAIVTIGRDGRIELVNAQTENYFRYGRAELVGQPVELLVPDRFREQHGEHREHYHANPTSRSMGAKIDLYGRRKDGSEFPVEISLSPLETPRGVVVTSIIRDVTVHRQAERARIEAQERYRDLVNNLPVGVYRNTVGPEGRFLEVNPAIVAMFEADSVEEFIRHPVSHYYRDPDGRRAFDDKITQQGFVANEELELITLKGRVFWGAITAVMKKDGAGNRYFDGIVEDISARKATERHIRELNDSLRNRSSELEAINRELEAFSYSVSHDLRAPLRAIDGFSRILANDYADRLDDAGRDRLQRVRRAAQHMGALIDDLLKLSRVTRADLKREEVDLSALANEVFEELRKQEPQRAVGFAASPGLSAYCDRRLLRIVLDNLLGNAWKFTGGRADAQIELGAERHNGVMVYFVRDNGAGFDMAYVDKLFGAFQRLHDASEFPGTGIGLATVQRVIHKHGGRIWGEGAVNQGAAFYFTLQPEES